MTTETQTCAFQSRLVVLHDQPAEFPAVSAVDAPQALGAVLDLRTAQRVALAFPSSEALAAQMGQAWPWSCSS